MSKIKAIVNQKGGVGKTTTAVNLAAGLAQSGQEILLVDIDPQANATSGIGINKQAVKKSTYHVMAGQIPLVEALQKVEERLTVLPASEDLIGAEVELVGMPNREYCLKEALASIIAHYQYVIIDCPPSLGLLTLNALTAAQEAVIPIQCEYYALEGVSQILKTIDLVQARLNPELKLGGVVLTMYDPRNSLSNQVIEEIKKYFKEKVFETIIPRNVRLAEAPGHSKSIFHYDRASKGAAAYELLAQEVSYRDNILKGIREEIATQQVPVPELAR